MSWRVNLEECCSSLKLVNRLRICVDMACNLSGPLIVRNGLLGKARTLIMSSDLSTDGIQVYLSMILGANFSSESGPEILVNMSLLLKFGGHMLTKKGATRLFANEKGSHR